MTNPILCPIPKLTDESLTQRLKKQLNDASDDVKSDMTIRVERLKRIVGWQKGVSPGQTAGKQLTARELIWNRMNNTMNKLGLQNVAPENLRNTSVYRLLKEVERKSKGFVDELIATNEFELKLGQVDRKLESLRKAYNIPTHEFNLLKTKGLEVGWQPYLNDYEGITPNGFLYLKSQQQSFIKQLQSYNMSQADIEQFVKHVQEPIQAFHEALLIARNAGIDVGDLKTSGVSYFPHQYSGDYLRRLKWKLEEGGTAVSFGDGTRSSISDAFNKSRSTSIFVVEDEVVLDWLFRGANTNIYEELSQRTGHSIKGIGDVLDNDKAILTAVADVLPDTTVQHLVQIGLLSKIPMTSDIVFKELKKAYQLPYENVNELMQVDFVGAIKLYRKQLEELVLDSAEVYSITRAAVKEGWGITDEVFNSNPSKYAGWSPLSASLPEAVIKKFSVAEDLNVPNRVIHSTYVSPEVARAIKSELSIYSNPAALGIMGDGISFLKKWYATMWLSTSQFVGRQFMNNFSQVFAAGGNIFSYTEDMMRRLVHVRKGLYDLSYMDDVKKVYRIDGTLVSERELYRKLIQTGYINDYTQASVEASSPHYIPKASILQQMKRSATYMNATWNQFPGHFGKLGKQSVDYLDTFVNGRLGAPFRFFNAEFENVAKFSLAKSMFSDKFNIMGVLSGTPTPKVNTGNDFVNYANKFFYHYDEPVSVLRGNVGEVITSVAPFLNYRTQNLLGTARQVLHNPSKFATYLEIYSVINGKLSDDEGFPAGGVPDYVYDTMPVFFKMKKEDTELAHDTYYYFPMGSILQQLGAVGELINMKNLLFGRSKKQLVDNAPFAEDTNFLNAVLDGETYGWTKFLKALVTGEDPDSGFPIGGYASKPSSILGIRVSPWTKYAIESFLPPIETLDRWNPANIFGQVPYYDQYTEEYVEGYPSVFGAERTAKSSDDRPQWGTAIGHLFGIKANFIDVGYGMALTRNEIQTALYDSSSILKQLATIERQSVTPQERERARFRYEVTLEYLVQLRIEFRKVDKWLIDNGFTTSTGLRVLKEKGLQTQDLPDLSPEQKEEIRQEVLREAGLL